MWLMRIGTHSIDTLVELYGTPIYVYDAENIIQRWNEIPKIVNDQLLGVYYACKANNALQIANLITGLGAGLYACSPGDLEIAKSISCFGERVSYSGVGLSDSDFEAVTNHGAFFTADSINQIESYASMKTHKHEIGIRINCGITTGQEQSNTWYSKFGIHELNIQEAINIAKANDLEVVGLHSHIGSEIVSPVSYLSVFGKLLTLSRQIQTIKFINIGGGFDDQFPLEDLTTEIDSLLKFDGREIQLRIEPGHFLVGRSGYLIAKITEIKRPVTIDEYRTTDNLVFIDSSYNHLARSVIDDKGYPITVASSSESQRRELSTVCGNLMQAGDRIAKDRILTKATKDDLIVVSHCGSYSSSRATNFNGRPRPAEILVNGDKSWMIRRAETVDDLYERDLMYWSQ